MKQHYVDRSREERQLLTRTVLVDTDGTAVPPLTAGDPIDANNPLPVTTAQIGEVQASPTANTVLDRLKTLSTELTAITALFPATIGQKAKAASLSVALASDQDAIALAAGEAFVGAVGSPLTNPSSTLTRPTPDVTGYSQNDLIASSATAGSVVVPSFTAARVAAGSFMMRKARLYTAKTSGMSAFQCIVEFWSAAPTFTNGDNGAYAVATGAASWLGRADFDVMTQVADGGYAAGIPHTGSDWGIKLGSGQVVYWTLKEIDATGFTPAAAQTFTLIPEIYQN